MAASINSEASGSMKDFKIVQLLGKGSYGSVYKVKRRTDGEIYAVKEVNIRKLSPREREDAVNEIRILASIRHQNIVRYCEAFVERDNLYIVMELAQHGDVYNQIKKFKAANKYIKEDTIWSYLIQMCNGLDELHSRKILHRDIKPKNVFLTGKNHIRVGDLGCAKLMKGGMARTQIGTPYYMSPEIWSHRPYDQKSDIWALGAMLYELCMLNPPFLANDMNALARKVKTAPTPRISKHYSTELHAIINSMLNKNPTARPSVSDILSNPSVSTRLHLAPAADGSKWVDERESAMLATIKVPRYMGYGAAKGLKLPEAAYPTDRPAEDVAAAPSRRPESSPAKAQRVAHAAPQVRPVSAKPSSKVPVVASHGMRKVPSAAGLGYKESKVSAAPSTRYSRAPSSRGAVGRSAAVLGRVPSSGAIPSRAGLGKVGVPSSHRPTAAAARRYGAAAAAVGHRAPSGYQAPAGYRGVSSRPW